MAPHSSAQPERPIDRGSETEDSAAQAVWRWLNYVGKKSGGAWTRTTDLGIMSDTREHAQHHDRQRFASFVADFPRVERSVSSRPYPALSIAN
jgi:hypothetical protein